MRNITYIQHTTDEQSECGCPSCEHYELVNARNEIKRLREEKVPFNLSAAVRILDEAIAEQDDLWEKWRHEGGLESAHAARMALLQVKRQIMISSLA